MTHPVDETPSDVTVEWGKEQLDEIKREKEKRIQEQVNQNIKELVRHLAPLIIRMQYLLGQSIEKKKTYEWLYNKLSENLEKLLQDESFVEVLNPLQPLIHKLPALIDKINETVINRLLHADRSNDSIDVVDMVSMELKKFYRENKAEIDNSLHIAITKLFAGIPVVEMSIGWMKEQLQLDKLLNARAKVGKFMKAVTKPGKALEKTPQDLSGNSVDLITPIGNMIKLFKPILVEVFKENLTTGSNLKAIHSQMKPMFSEFHSRPTSTLFATAVRKHLSSDKLKELINYMAKTIDDAFIDKILKKFDKPEDLEQAQHLIMNLVGPYMASQSGFNYYISAYSTEQSEEILKKIFKGFEELLLEQLTDPFLDVLPLKERLVMKGYLALFANKGKLREMVTSLCDTIHDNIQTKLMNPPEVAEYQIALRKLNRQLAEKLLSNKPITNEQQDKAQKLFEDLTQKSQNLQTHIKDKDQKLKAQLQKAKDKPALTTEGEKDWIYTASRLKEILDKFDKTELDEKDYKDLETLQLFDPTKFKNWGDLVEFGKQIKTKVEGKLVVSNELAAISRAYVKNQQLSIIVSKLDHLKESNFTIESNLEILKKLHKTLDHQEQQLAKFLRENKTYEENKHKMTDSFRAWFKGITVEQLVEHKKEQLDRAKELKELLKNHRMSGTETMLNLCQRPNDTKNDTKADENIKKISEKIHNLKDLLGKQKESGSELDKICDTIDQAVIKPCSGYKA